MIKLFFLGGISFFWIFLEGEELKKILTTASILFFSCFDGLKKNSLWFRLCFGDDFERRIFFHEG